LVLGHEFAGVIACGPRTGERVVLDPSVPCARCEACLAGLPHLCPVGRFAGHGSTDGALRTSLAWPEGLAHPLPERIADAEAALLEPLGVALHGLDLAHVRSGTRVGVFGCGPLGLLLVQAVGAAGGETIVATDPLEHRRRAARPACSPPERSRGAGSTSTSPSRRRGPTVHWPMRSTPSGPAVASSSSVSPTTTEPASLHRPPVGRA